MHIHPITLELSSNDLDINHMALHCIALHCIALHVITLHVYHIALQGPLLLISDHPIKFLSRRPASAQPLSPLEMFGCLQYMLNSAEERNAEDKMQSVFIVHQIMNFENMAWALEKGRQMQTSCIYMGMMKSHLIFV